MEKDYGNGKFCSEHRRALPWLGQGGCSRGFEVLSVLKPGRGKGQELSWRLQQASRHSRTRGWGQGAALPGSGKAHLGWVDVDAHGIEPRAFTWASRVQENLISPTPCISLDL